MIHLSIPTREEGRKSVRGLQAPPLETVRVAFVGLGQRGLTLLRLMMLVPHARITVLCNTSSEQLAAALAATGLSTDDVRCYSGEDCHLEACQAEDVDIVYVCTDWASHVPVAVAAMQAGKHVAIEVPAALTMDDLWLLVDTAEQCQRHCTLLENCCYDQEVQQAIRRIRNQEIGEIVHAEGCYYHELKGRWSPWRLDINRRLRGDLYPTHEFGPLCQALDITRTDHLQTLVSMDSASWAGREQYEEAMGCEAPDFQNGDHTTTLIRTTQGRTLLLRHDVTTEQPYSRHLRFVGTRGVIETGHDTSEDQKEVCSSFYSVHDPMTYEMNRRIVECLHRGLPLDIDVYDLATWCSVIPLSRLSIESGSEPVNIPSFI